MCLNLFFNGNISGDGNISLSCPGTTYENQGLVSVSFENSNYHVCFGGFNRGAAAAVCRELGFVDAEIVVHDNPPLYYGTPHSLGYVFLYLLCSLLHMFISVLVVQWINKKKGQIRSYLMLIVPMSVTTFITGKCNS